MAFELKNKYWKIVDIRIDRQLKKADVILVGFVNKTDADKPKFAQYITGYPKHRTVLEKEFYPFVNDASPNQTALAYVNIKTVDSFFKDAKDV